MNELIPELENKQRIEDGFDTGNPMQIQAATGRALHNAVLAIVNTRLAINGLSNSMGDIKKRIDTLNGNLQQFSDSTTELSRQANRLIRWYVILTGVIALATVVAVFFR